MPFPIYIITLKGAAQRRQPLLDKLAEFEIPYRLWFGVDGRNGLPEDMEPRVDREMAYKNQRRYLSDGEFACALSHQSIYQDMLGKNLDAAIILEDDAIIDQRFCDYFNSEQNRAFDLLLLDHQRTYVLAKKVWDIIPDTRAFRVTLPPNLGTGYVIGAHGARALIKGNSPICNVADWPIDISRLNAWAALPTLVMHTNQRTGASHLRDSREASRTNVVQSSESKYKRVLNKHTRVFKLSYWRYKWKRFISRRIA